MKKAFFALSIIFILGLANFAFAEEPVKILLVPGHDKSSPGSIYGNLKEVDMNLSLANELLEILKKDPRFEVHITRDWEGYTEEFANYFSNSKKDISFFITEAKNNIRDKILSGEFVQKANTPHGSAPDAVVLKLYGINKWANENKIDAVVHVHFNDYKRKTKWTIGDRKGFAIYIPEEQFANSDSSFKLADSIFEELKKKYITSNYVNELGGMVFDQKLIAIGANNTLDPGVRAVLIEYDYIYRLGDRPKRLKSYENMANLTAVGIKNYFFPKNFIFISPLLER